jgi:hypothetical protein
MTKNRNSHFIARIRKLRPNAATIKRFETLVEELDHLVAELPGYVAGDPTEVEAIGDVMIDSLFAPTDEYSQSVAITLGQSVHALFLSDLELVQSFQRSLIEDLVKMYGPADNEPGDVDEEKLKKAVACVNQFVEKMTAIFLP